MERRNWIMESNNFVELSPLPLLTTDENENK